MESFENPKVKFMKKEASLRAEILQLDWADDKIFNGGSYAYTYTSIDKLRKQIGPLFAKHGLELDVNVKDVRELRETKSFPARLLVVLEYIMTDVDTGYCESNTMVGEGGDLTDKALTKAVTNANKNWFIQKWQIADGMDPDAAQPSAFHARTPEQELEIKSSLQMASLKPNPAMKRPSAPVPNSAPAPAPAPVAQAPKEEPKLEVPKAETKQASGKFVPSDPQQRAMDKALQVQQSKVDAGELKAEEFDLIKVEYNSVDSAMDASAFVKKYKS